MKELFKGVKDFCQHEFEKNKNLYEDLSQKQNPHTLFIGCSDSRVIPNLITNSLPGDLFIIRNIANIVPPFRQSSEYLSTTSAIEYAVNVLEVKNIVICGHSNCGGCKALSAEDQVINAIPHTKRWLELAQPAKATADKIKAKEHGNDCIDRLVEQENIILQMHHLLTYPYIKEKYDNKELQIFGWYYDIGKGMVYNYDKQNQTFEPIK